MNKQMEMAFMKQGGIKDDGMTKDPVSGNNIPPGSMATEVRDDVPAMLSEGEYVVPADVLRYYGVNFFENLRGQAKNGLQTMEQNGRIGGTPLSDQDVARNMQQPMMSPQPPQASNTAQPQQQMMANQGMMVQGFDNGTAQVLPNITSQYASSFSPATARYSSPMFQGTSSQLANVAAAQQQTAAQEITTMVTHYDKDGNQMQIKYVSVGGADPKVAEGQDDFLKQYDMTEVQYAEYKKTQNQSQGSDKKPNPFEKPKVDKIGPLVDIGAMDAVGVEKWATETLKPDKVNKLLGKFGPALQLPGIGQQARAISEIRAMAKYRESLGGADNIALAKTLTDQANAAIDNLGLEALDALGLMSGNNIYKDIVGYTPGQSQPSLPNASNGQTVPYMFTDDNGNPLTASNYQFAEALAGTYGWEARHFAVQQQASMMLNDKGIEDNTYYGGGTQSNDVTVANDPSGGETQTIVPSGGPGTFPVSDNTSPATAEQIATATQTSEAANANVDFTPGTDLGTDEDVEYDDTFYNEGGLMAAPKKKKKRQPKKGGLAGKK